MNASAEKNASYDNTMDILNRQMTELSLNDQFLSFSVGDEEYAVEVLMVQEIIRYVNPTKIPNSPSVIKGIINFRGKIIPIIDLPVKFGLTDRKYDSFTIIIVLEVKGKIMGIIVDSVSDVLSFAPDEIQDVNEELGSEINIEHVAGLGKLENGRLVQILAVDKLLSIEEIVAMQKIKKEKIEDEE